MTDITVNLPEKSLDKLREKAAACGVSPEELVRAVIDQLLAGPDEEFEKVTDYVLKKNAELYRRLA